MELQCPVLLEGNVIPPRYTCDSDGISPPLTWHNPPDGTRAFALIVEDPDAPKKTFTHWVAYDIPADVHQLPEGISERPTLPDGGSQGKNDFGKLGFGGPCPPAGTHRYVFRLYALDQTLGLEAGAVKADLLSLISGHVLETAELIGLYNRQHSS
jgi:Raf kinase inhibitor-like YbhB/YbcL family protein